MPSLRYAQKQLKDMAQLLERKSSIPQVAAKLPLIKEIGTDAFWEASDILALENVDFVIIYAKRDNDWKFSVRSETPAMDAGEIIHEALLGIGNGGGHAAMAGGMISKENLYLLGPKPDNKLCELFLSTIKRLSEEADESDEAEEADD